MLRTFGIQRIDNLIGKNSGDLQQNLVSEIVNYVARLVLKELDSHSKFERNPDYFEPIFVRSLTKRSSQIRN